MTAHKPADRLSSLNNWITIIAVPIGLAVAGWLASTFDSLRIDVTTIKTSLGYVQQDIGRHSTQLDGIEKTLAKRR